MSYNTEILAADEHGEFYGAEFTVDECDLYRDVFVQPRLLKLEPDLERLKWFDYREHHTVINTFRFAADYRSMYQSKAKELIDEDRAQHMRGYSGDDIFQNPRALTGMWTARQHADRLTMPYPTYLRFAFDDVNERKWQRMPSATQLYSPAITKAVSERWVKQVMTEAPMPTSSRFIVNAQDNTPHDDVLDFQAWLVESIKSARNLTSTLSHYLFYAKLIRAETVIDHFGSDALEKAVKFYNRTK